MFNFKRKDITPIQSAPKKPSEDPPTSQAQGFQTPVRPIDSSSQSNAPRSNRTRQSSVFSTTSFKSTIDQISVKSAKIKMSQYDIEATRNGKMRDLIEIDVLVLDGEPYTAQISEIEAYKLIYRRALKLDKAICHGIKISWAGHPLVEIRLKEKIDIDELTKRFEYKKPDFDRDGNEISRTVGCEIRGVRDPLAPVPDRARRQADDDMLPKTRWVKIEGTGFDLKANYLENMLDYFGERLSDVEVETLEFHDSDSESDTDSKVTLATGNLSVKMELSKDMPQYIPLYGKKVKIYYRGIAKACSKCYETGHIAKDCKNERVTLVNYVDAFMTNYPDFRPELYGRWNKLVDFNRKLKATNPSSSK